MWMGLSLISQSEKHCTKNGLTWVEWVAMIEEGAFAFLQMAKEGLREEATSIHWGRHVTSTQLKRRARESQGRDMTFSFWWKKFKLGDGTPPWKAMEDHLPQRGFIVEFTYCLPTREI